MKVDVLLPLKFDHPFTYLNEKDEALEVGDFVLVPFNNKKIVGVIWSLKPSVTKKNIKFRPVFEKLDLQKLSKSKIEFIIRFATYNLIELGLVLKLFIFNPYFQAKNKKKIQENNNFENSKIEKEILLDSTQQKSYEYLTDVIKDKEYSCTLLHGVTGSGKTLIYLKKIKYFLDRGFQVLLVLPEIALTKDMLDRLEEYFNIKPPSWHSLVKQSEKKKIWDGLLNGKINFVVGTRSSLFLPFKNLGLVIVDEEHDQSFKQEEQITYNARDMSILYASIEKIPILLVSATPSLETYYNYKIKKFNYYYISKRYRDVSFPKVKFVDLSKEKLVKPIKFISPSIIDDLKEYLINKKQILFFLNKRGYSNFVICSKCGTRQSCPNCSVYLTYHKEYEKLICHYCDHQASLKNKCNKDGLCNFLFYGVGVEKVYEEIQSIFPKNKIILFSSDFIKNEEDAEEILQKIKSENASIIVATQLISKGFHFPNLNCIVVINSDTSFLGNDVRSSEKTYQLLNQLTGRAGREDNNSIVYLQTHQKENTVLQAISRRDDLSFYDNELNFRKDSNLPPFSKFISIIVSGTNKFDTKAFSLYLKNNFPFIEYAKVLGPVSAPISLLKGKFRSRLLIKYPNDKFPQNELKKWLRSLKLKKNVSISLDVDPISLR